ANIAAAAPVNGAFAIKNATPGNVETVRYYGGWRGGWGGWRGGWGRGWGYYGGGFAAGAVLGGLLAAPYYYGGYSPYYYTGYAPYYGAPYYGGGYYDDGYAGGGVEYCMQRYRTYDPRSGTFMGNDGLRHPCP
ncbi:MAG TPA: BA14K family protein, partial [Pseudolabrys sp.]|nr:BA14K family protein [Pseudolabrys sp.]